MSQPLTPNNIPPQEFTETPRPPRPRRIANPLAFVPLGWLPQVLRLPGIIVFGIFGAYFLGRARFNVLLVLVLAHITYFVFKRRADAYARSLDQLARSKARRDDLAGFETVEWMNYIVRKFWEVSEASISSQIYSQVNQVLKENTPKILKSLKLTELTLGTRPPVVERIGFMERTEDAIVVEFAVNFIPLQTDEDILSYFGEEKSHWNTCIELTATVGFISLPVLVRNFTFSGMFRAEIALTRRIPFLRQLSVSMLDLPVVDFELQPLKVVDFMDLPYLSMAIHGLMNKVIRDQALYPKQITVDLSKVAEYAGTTVGVLYLHVGMLHAQEDAAFSIELSKNGQRFAATAVKSGAFPLFDEGFYEIVSDTTRYIGLALSSGQSSYAGRLYLRNLNRHRYSESLHLASELARRFVDVSATFFPLTAEKTASAIVDLSVVSVAGLRCRGDPVNRLYSTYCKVTLQTKESLRAHHVLRSFETKRIFSSRDPFYNESMSFFVRNFADYMVEVAVMDEKNDGVLGAVLVQLSGVEDGVATRYRIGGVESGDVELKFALRHVDIRNEEPEAAADEVAAAVAAPEPEPEEASEITVTRTASEHIVRNRREVIEQLAERGSTGIPGGYRRARRRRLARRQRVEEERRPPIEPLTLGIYNRRPPSSRVRPYRRACRIRVEEINERGAFYLVFETDRANWKMEPFSTDMAIDRAVVVPVRGESSVRARLFRMLLGGDVLVAEEWCPLKNGTVLFENVRITFSVEEKEFVDAAAAPRASDTRVVQFRLSRFSTEGNYSLDVWTDRLVVYQKLPCLLTVATGAAEIRCALRQDGAVRSHFVLPVQNAERRLEIDEHLSCDLHSLAQACGFEHPVFYSRGILEVYVLKANGVRPLSDASANPYIKVHANGEQIFKTQRRSRDLNPIFNESFKVAVVRNIDTLGFYINDYSAVAPSRMLCFKEISLFNVPEGYSRYDLAMEDGKTGAVCGTVLQVIFNYTNMRGEGSIMDIYSDWKA